MPNVFAYRSDYLFQTMASVWGGHPNSSRKAKDLTGRTTDNGVGKRSQAGLEDIDTSTRGFCAILSWDLVAHEKSLSFTYGRPVGKPNKFVLEP